MGIVAGIWMVILGVVGASGLRVARRPTARAVTSARAGYQGWIGAVSAAWGLWQLAGAWRYRAWQPFAPVFWWTYLALGAVQCGLGLVMGVGALKSFTRDADREAALDGVVLRLTPLRGSLGVASIATGLWVVAVSLLPSVA